jgi:hypothetical protein
MCRRSVQAWFGLASILLAVTALRADETYHINLSPSARPGQKFRYTAIERESTTLSNHFGTIVPADSQCEFHFSAIATVEECSIGRPIQVKLSEPSLKNGDGQELLPGEELTAKRVAITEQKPRTFKDVFAMKGEPVKAFLAAALGKVITIGGEIEPTEQDLLGPDKPLAVGDAWHVNAQSAARVFEKFHLAVDPDSVAGYGQLVERLKFRNEFDAVKIEIDITAMKYTPRNDKENHGTATAHLQYYISTETGLIREASYRVNTDIVVVPPYHNTTSLYRVIKLREVPK